MSKFSTGVSRLPLLAARLFDTPLLVHPRKLKAIVAASARNFGLYDDDDDGELREAREDYFLAAHGDPVDPKGYAIAVIPIHGSLVHRDMDAWSGMVSYEELRASFRAALNDGSVSAILFDISSGGGEVSGCFDLVDEIFAARGTKPIYAFANEHAFSAAYALASAADKIFMPRTGSVGSIGVVGVHVDQSGADKEAGFVFTPVYAGKHKIDGWPHGPLSEEAKTAWEQSIDGIYQIFTETVARNRGLSVKAVAATEAACFDGADAVAQGLADGIATLDTVLDMIVADLGGRNGFSGQGGREAFSGPTGEDEKEKGPDMAMKLLGKKKRAAADAPAADETDKQPAEGQAEGAEMPPAEEPEKKEPDDKDGDEAAADGGEEKQGSAEDASALSTKNAADISDLCVLYGESNLAAGFIRQGLSAEAVRKELLSRRNSAEKAKAAAGATLQTAHGGANKEPSNSLVEDMKRRFPQK